MQGMIIKMRLQYYENIKKTKILKDKRIKKIIVILLILLFSIGVEQEYSSIYSLDLSFNEFLRLLMSISLLSLYFIPLVIFILYLSRKSTINISLIVISILSGVFIASWMSKYGNYYADEILRLILSKDQFEIWNAALTAPFVEEFLKASCACSILYVFKFKGSKNYLFAGIGTGLGFQLSEDVSYIILNIDGSINELIPQAFIRMSGFVSSHWMFTGIFLVGVYCLRNKDTKKTGVKLIAFTVSLHVLWNSPLNNINLSFPIIPGILSTCIIYQFIKVYMFVQQKEEKYDIFIKSFLGVDQS